MSNQAQHAGTMDAGVHEDSHDHHNPYLQHHFDSMEQQFDSTKQGMWLFLATEVLFFGGLFCAYAVYRANHPEVFIYAHQYLDKILGGVNTVVLIFSSFTMAWAVRCAQRNFRTGLIVNLAITILCAFIFLGIKYVEYKHKWEDGLLWGTHFDPQKYGHVGFSEDGIFREVEENGAPDDAEENGAPEDTEENGAPDDAEENGTPNDAEENGAPEDTEENGAPDDADENGAPDNAEENEETAKLAEGEEDPYFTPAYGMIPEDERTSLELAAPGPAGLAQEPDAYDYGEQPSKLHIFFGIYFAMTGLHAIHVIVGIGLLGWILIRAINGEFGSGYFTPVDLVGLYWHIVDLIWIYLFPLLYLIH